MNKSKRLTNIGWLLIAAALCLSGYNLWSGYQAGVKSQAVYRELEAMPLAEGSSLKMPVKIVDGHEYIGIVRISKLNLELPIMQDWSYPNLLISPCRYTGSVYTNDMILCAHNSYEHFGRLKTLSLNDTIEFEDMAGKVYTYRIFEISTLQPEDVKEMEAGDWDLTLFTCDLFGAVRITVRCTLVF